MFRRLLGGPQASFLFMDETFCQERTKISALTGLLVPAERYTQLRDQFYEILLPFIQPEPNVINMDPPEVHGYKLPGTEEQKLAVAASIVDLVINNGLQFYRVGYYTDQELGEAFKLDPQMLSISWESMCHMLEPYLAERLIQPIMDSVNKDIVRKFASTVRACDIMRAAGQGASCSIEHSENLLEVAFVDSKYSTFTQVVDVVGYLRKITDLEDDAKKLPQGKQELLPLARKLDVAKGEEYIIPFNLDGEVHGPSHRGRLPITGKGPLVAGESVKPRDP